jgi:hypothetical protein
MEMVNKHPDIQSEYGQGQLTVLSYYSNGLSEDGASTNEVQVQLGERPLRLEYVFSI